MTLTRVLRLVFLLALLAGCRSPSWEVGERDDPRNRWRGYDGQRVSDIQSPRGLGDFRNQRAENQATIVHPDPIGKR